jgi:hypothetical protein
MSDTPPPRQVPAPLPTAVVVRQRRHAWVWLIPIAAVVLATVLYVMYVQKRGSVIQLNMSEGHGIKAGDTLRCRGIVIGQVETVALSPDMSGVRVMVRLVPSARDVPVQGSRFWVERPRVSLTNIGGLDTIAGPRYLVVIPGQGKPQREFDALPAPPIVELHDASALEVTLLADQRAGLREGAPVLFRGVTIGRILSVGLSNDSGYVESRAYIEPAYAQLVHADSRFWNVSGVAFDVGITGIRMDVTSMQALLDGGVMVATPSTRGEPVETGHRFRLHAKPEVDWLMWRPSLPVGGELLPAGQPVPDMVLATLSMSGGTLWTRRYERKAWLLPVENGPLVPASFVEGLTQDATISLLGQKFPISSDIISSVSDDVAQLHLRATDDMPMSLWPGARVLRISEPVDCVLIGDPQQPMLIAATRQRYDERGFFIDQSISIDPSWQGAAAISQVDGNLIGVVVFDDEQAIIAPVTVLTGN